MRKCYRIIDGGVGGGSPSMHVESCMQVQVVNMHKQVSSLISQKKGILFQ